MPTRSRAATWRRPRSRRRLFTRSEKGRKNCTVVRVSRFFVVSTRLVSASRHTVTPKTCQKHEKGKRKFIDSAGVSRLPVCQRCAPWPVPGARSPLSVRSAAASGIASLGHKVYTRLILKRSPPPHQAPHELCLVFYCTVNSALVHSIHSTDGSTSALQQGQKVERANHLSMHAAWKM